MFQFEKSKNLTKIIYLYGYKYQFREKFELINQYELQVQIAFTQKERLCLRISLTFFNKFPFKVSTYHKIASILHQLMYFSLTINICFRNVYW